MQEPGDAVAAKLFGCIVHDAVLSPVSKTVSPISQVLSVFSFTVWGVGLHRGSLLTAVLAACERVTAKGGESAALLHPEAEGSWCALEVCRR